MTITIGKRGTFNEQAVCGFFEREVDSAFPTQQMYGMTIDGLCPNAALHDEDGNIWNLVRYHTHNNTIGLRILTNADGRPLYEGHPDAARAYTGPVRNWIEDGAHCTDGIAPLTEAAKAANRQGFRIRRTLDTLEWDEGDILSLRGDYKWPAMYWFSPNADGGWAMSSFVARVEGTLCGRKVHGYSEFATLWTAPGIDWSTVYAREGVAWMIVANEYDNGEVDLAHIGMLKNDCQFAMTANESGPLSVTRDVKLEAEVDENGYPARLLYSLPDEQWEWKAVANADIYPPNHPLRRDREGVVQRVGDTRKPHFSTGWVNFFSDDRIKKHLK